MRKKLTAAGALAAAVLIGTAPMSIADKDTSKADDATMNNPAVENTKKADRIAHIIVSGNVTVKPEKILQYATETKTGEAYDREKVKRDLKRIMSSGLVQDANARALQNNGELYVVFDIKEVSDVKGIAFEGNTLIPSEVLMPLMSTKTGGTLNKDDVTKDITAIKKAYAEKGYIVTVPEVNDNDGTLTFTIAEAKIGKIVYNGNEKTKDWLMNKLVSKYLSVGDYLRPINLQGAYTALAGTGYFSNVKINALDAEDKKSNDVTLEVTVTEQRTGAWNIGGAYSDTYKGEIVCGIYDKNLGGTGKSLNLDLGFGKSRNHYSLTYTDPYFKKSNTSVYMQAFKTDKDIDNSYFEYTEAHTGGEIGFARPVSKDGRTTFSANFRADKIDVSDQKKGYLMKDTQENTVSLGISHDGRKGDGSGSVLEAAATFSQKFLGSDEDFSKFTMRIKNYARLAANDVLATRIEANFSPDDLSGVEQFSIGGANSVRGIEEDEQRGDKSLLATVEYRHTFNKNLQGVVFVDTGKAWSDAVGNAFKTATGVGVRIKTAMGVLRLDAAKSGGNSVKYLFGIGQSF